MVVNPHKDFWPCWWLWLLMHDRWWWSSSPSSSSSLETNLIVFYPSTIEFMCFAIIIKDWVNDFTRKGNWLIERSIVSIYMFPLASQNTGVKWEKCHIAFEWYDHLRPMIVMMMMTMLNLRNHSNHSVHHQPDHHHHHKHNHLSLAFNIKTWTLLTPGVH